MTARKLLKDKLSPQTLHDLQNRRITSRALALKLKVSETHLSRVLSSLNQTKTPGQTAIQRQTLSEAHAKQASLRSHLAKQVQEKVLTTKQAALKAGCSERTMWRYLAALSKAAPKAQKD